MVAIARVPHFLHSRLWQSRPHQAAKGVLHLVVRHVIRHVVVAGGQAGIPCLVVGIRTVVHRDTDTWRHLTIEARVERIERRARGIFERIQRSGGGLLEWIPACAAAAAGRWFSGYWLYAGLSG